jgi:hypothetical protein
LSLLPTLEEVPLSSLPTPFSLLARRSLLATDVSALPSLPHFEGTNHVDLPLPVIAQRLFQSHSAAAPTSLSLSAVAEDVLQRLPFADCERLKRNVSRLPRISVSSLCSGSNIPVKALHRLAEAMSRSGMECKFDHVFSIEIEETKRRWILRHK